MIENALLFGILICGIYPSLLSAIYVSVAFAYFFDVAFLKKNKHKIYKGLIGYSFIVIIWKFLAIIIFYSDKNSELFKGNDELLKVFGIFLSNHAYFDSDAALTIFPDLSVLLATIFLVKYTKKYDLWVKKKILDLHDKQETSEELGVLTDSPMERKKISFFWKIIAYLNYLLELFSVWITFLILFLIMLLSDLNFINFGRFFIICYFLSYLMIKMQKTINNSLRQVFVKWKFLTIYSFSTFAIRYLYQFCGYFYDINNDITGIIGLASFSVDSFYKIMICECIILCTLLFFSNNYQKISMHEDELSPIYSWIKSIEVKEVNLVKLFASLGKHFNLLLFLVIFLISIFRRLSISMLVYLFFIGRYCMKICYEYCKNIENEIEKDYSKDLLIRLKLWLQLFYLTIICILISYLSFIINFTDFGEGFLEYAQWFYFLFGFSVAPDDDLLIAQNYEYICILISLIIEKLCIEALQNNESRSALHSESYWKLLSLLKLFAEAIVPAMLLTIAFARITFISIIYVFTVIYMIFSATPDIRAKISNKVVVFMIWLEYILYLTNLGDDSPIPVPKIKGNPIPWIKEINWNSDYPEFLNVGVDFSQVKKTFGELFLLIVIQAYFIYLSNLGTELQVLPLDRAMSRTSKLSMKILIFIKNVIYSSCHYFSLFISLLFVIQSPGLISLVFCLFCLFFIFKANDIYKSQEKFEQYRQAFKNYLIIFIIIELTLQIIYQIPLHSYYPSVFKEILEAFGLVQLWSAGESGIGSTNIQRKRIFLKVYSFGLLLLAYRIMKNSDFQVYINKKREKFNGKAILIGIKMAQKFNDKRVRKNNQYIAKKEKFENELRKLDYMINSWNNIFYGNESGRVKIERSKTINQEAIDMNAELKIDAKRKFEKFLLYFINEVLFEKFINSLYHEPSVSNNDESVSCESVAEERSLYEINFSIEESSENDFEKNKIFQMKFKDYFIAILLGILSNTESIVYFMFIMNHIIYASLESIVFPLSIFAYALLEYPRPRPIYFRIMTLYAQLVIIIKYIFQLSLWKLLFGDDVFKTYYDTGKIGFNLASNTYSENLINYVILDALCMLALYAHEYYLMRTGLSERSETEIESLEEAYARNSLEYPDMPIIHIDENQGFFKKIILKLNLFLQRLTPYNKDEKPGIDLYTPIILIQLWIFIYLLFFFSKMDWNYSSASNVFVTNSFPGRMVVALLFHLFIMLLDRFLYLKSTKKEVEIYIDQINIGWEWRSVGRFSLHILLVLTVHALVFWYFPINGNNGMSGTPYCLNLFEEKHCNNFQVNFALQWFYIFYVIYFILVTLQFQVGLPSLREVSFPLMRHTDKTSNIFFKIYRGLPFVFELRTVIDWSLTKTSLVFFDWLRFEDINAQLYQNQCDAESNKSHIKGQTIGIFSKIFIGGCVILFILASIFAPLIIFSSLNPIIYENSVKKMSIEIGIVTVNNNYYNIFTGSKASILKHITSKEWSELNFNSLNDVVATEKDITQIIQLETIPDNFWIISPTAKKLLCTSLTSYNSSFPDYYLQAIYSFERKYPASQTQVQNNKKKKLTNDQVHALANIICNNSNETFSCPKCFPEVIMIQSAGDAISPSFITDTDYYLQLDMKYAGNSSYWEAGFWWNGNFNGLKFYVISNNYSPVTLNFSLITFYISVVLLIGRILRSIVSGLAQNIVMTVMPNPKPLINLCEGIYVSRITGDLEREDELYHELIDIARSPEIIKIITGRSSIKNKNE
ncbi:PIEZO2_2 [Blepharisma stoltei]|uniref:Piezo non-specific cation channel R-Ras-binding domain-containing protein n=1 Tax=Blepharisma stoltei TaxID=1481888 RepID=A0AAU9IF78_9CILI|nr:unnamed protein product [Blepharisma stoltei]